MGSVAALTASFTSLLAGEFVGNALLMSYLSTLLPRLTGFVACPFVSSTFFMSHVTGLLMLLMAYSLATFLTGGAAFFVFTTLIMFWHTNSFLHIQTSIRTFRQPSAKWSSPLVRKNSLVRYSAIWSYGWAK